MDFSVPTPAVVREGYLAPYQELVQLCSPLDSEQEWLAERHARFELALTRLADDGDLPGLDGWLLSRLSERLAASGGRLSWAELARRRPRLADAGLRWMHARGIAPPDDAPRGEQYRADLTIDDWVVLLEDYALRCLRADASAEAARRLDEMQVALGDLGFALTRQGIRRVGGEVDRVLLNSAAKPLAMCDALACEYESRGQGLRAVVLCDSEHPPRQAEDSPLALTGGARGLLASLGSDERFVGSRAGAGDRRDVRGPARRRGLVDATAGRPGRRGGPAGVRPRLRREAGEGLVVLRHADGGSTRRRGRRGSPRLLADGEILVLFGTRGLLGEGWDCPPVNVLVDMTAVAADVAVRQMRGRSLRLDPGDPTKLAGNWDIVCVAPQLGRGHADYARFVRRHAHLHAPCEDGTIETGPSHVHPELSPYGPPDAGRFVAINLEQQDRAVDRDAARGRWRIGEPYRGVDLDVLVVRNPRRVGEQPQVALADVRPLRSRWQTLSAAAGLAAAAAVTATGAALAAPALLVAGVLALLAAGAALVWARRVARRAHPAELPLEWAAGAVCDAYVALGEMTAEVARTMSFTVRPEGWVRVGLPDADAEVSRRVTAALDELYGGGALARYVVSRKVLPGGRTPGIRCRRTWRAAGIARRRSTPHGSDGWAPASWSTATGRTLAARTWRRRRPTSPPWRRSAGGSGASGGFAARVHAQRSSADRRGCAAWLFSSSCSRPPSAVAAAHPSPTCRVWPPTTAGRPRRSEGWSCRRACAGTTSSSPPPRTVFSRASGPA